MVNDTPADVAVIGLAVMGENLVLNMERNGYRVAVYNRSHEKVESFLASRAAGKQIIGAQSLSDLCGILSKPRNILIMIRAGAAVDDILAQLAEYLEPGDIVIDGGNSNFIDTNRRTLAQSERGLLFVGAGISGGEEGALHGPSIMPGGATAAWPACRGLLQDIAAKAEDGTPCCQWLGADGAGHYVKMVHNGIEYCDMQLIAEVYHIMSNGLEMKSSDMGAVFRRWNEGALHSFLIEITAEIFDVVDADTNKPLVDLILDKAGQKGTGKWTAISAIELGSAAPQVSEAVFARFISALKSERSVASKILSGPRKKGKIDLTVGDLHDALYATKICAYAQGFQMLSAASALYQWNLDLAAVAAIWRNGCIIRAAFLDRIMDAFATDPSLVNLMLDPFFTNVLSGLQKGWRKTICAAIQSGIPVPSMGSAASYYDSYRCRRLPANLIQAQRDYFGAHTYERIDRPEGTFFHTNWTGEGGATSSTTYNA